MTTREYAVAWIWRRVKRPCWLGGHHWRTEVLGIYLHIGTEHERMCNIVTCTRCRKARVSYGCYPPRGMPSEAPTGKVPRPAAWPHPQE